MELRLTDGSRLTTLLPVPTSGASGARTCSWRVVASPCGTLQPRAGPPVSSLFWEATPSRDALLLPDGARDTFVVRGACAGEWLLGALHAWGLAPREYTECASFWAPQMAEHPFVQVRLLPQEAWEAIAPLTVKGLPAPQRTLRVFIAWRGLRAFDPRKHAGALPAPPPAREEGVSYVVEWGGQEVLR